eukprot:TRINITY_DN3081_c0_g1_i1.p1 TRINITY_DN3081_c0_g1~~TRINITY_DN3081_c0_g1_i1.p1  ORF type:complete len:372 (-),score=119.70 TRINITY_DN3081_c0_g1_i1:110-1225(-)
MSSLRKEPYFAEVRYAYASKGVPMTTGEMDLTVQKGEILLVITDLKNGWYRAKSDDEIGLVPENYIKHVELMESQYAKANSIFKLSSGEKDLTFDKGKRFILVENCPNGWSRAKDIHTGEIGMVPLAYFSRVDPSVPALRLTQSAPPSLSSYPTNKGSTSEPVTIPKDIVAKAPLPPPLIKAQSLGKGDLTNSFPEVKKASSFVFAETRIVPFRTSSDPARAACVSPKEIHPSDLANFQQRKPSVSATRTILQNSEAISLSSKADYRIEEEDLISQLEELERMNRELDEKRNKAAAERKALEDQIRKEEEEVRAIALEEEELEKLSRELKGRDVAGNAAKKQELATRRNNTLRRKEVLQTQKVIEGSFIIL